MRIGKMLLEVAGNLVYIHPDTQEVYEAMVADFAPEKVLADASETGERATKEQETVHATCWRGPFIAACGADKPNQQTTTVDSHVTCPECKPLVLADKILAAWLKDAEEEPNNLKRRLRESHFRTGAYAEAFCEVGRSIPPRWLLDWVGDVAFLQELMNLWDAPPPNDVVFDHGWGGEERRRVLAILADMVGAQNHWPRVWLSRWRPNASPARNAHGKDRGLQVPGVRWGGGRADSTVFADSRLGADGGVLPAA